MRRLGISLGIALLGLHLSLAAALAQVPPSFRLPATGQSASSSRSATLSSATLRNAPADAVAPVAGPAAVVQPALLHALLILDTDANKIGPTVAIDRERMTRALGQAVDPEGRRRTRVVTLQGADATPQRVMQYFKDLKIAPADSLLVYYHGHGGRSQTDGHVLVMKHGSLPRSELRGAMGLKNARLSVLLTDCCDNVVRDNDKDDDTRQLPIKKPFPASEHVQWETFSKLFFSGQGDLVDVNACKPGEVSFVSSKVGGFFSAAVVHSWCQSPDEIAGGGELNWISFCDHANSVVEEHFTGPKVQQVFRNYTHQWPQHFWDKTLVVKNETSHTVKLHIAYQPHGQTDWITTPTTWTVAPGNKGTLHDKAHGNVLVAASRIRIWGESDDHQFQWTTNKSEPLKISDAPFGYADQKIGQLLYRLTK